MMERGRLKQRLSQMFRIPPFRSSCSTKSRKVDAVQEPLYVSRRYDWDDDGVLKGIDRALSLPHLSPGRRLRSHREETPVSSSQRSVDLRFGGRKMKEKRVSGFGDREGRMCPPCSPLSPSYYHFTQMKEEQEREERRISNRRKKGKEDEQGRMKGKKLLSNSYGFTSCSSEDSDRDDGGHFFSSEEGGGGNREGMRSREREGEATDILFSARSFSSDSSELYYHSSRRHNGRKKKSSQRQQKPKREDLSRRTHIDSDNGFRPVISISSSLSSSLSAKRVNEGVLAKGEEVRLRKEGFAVEKRSSDPYADFRSSMVEMIVEKQIFGATDLERLLRSYLTLNHPRHHPIIVQVFSEIWDALFGN